MNTDRSNLRDTGTFNNNLMKTNELDLDEFITPRVIINENIGAGVPKSNKNSNKHSNSNIIEQTISDKNKHMKQISRLEDISAQLDKIDSLVLNETNKQNSKDGIRDVSSNRKKSKEKDFKRDLTNNKRSNSTLSSRNSTNNKDFNRKKKQNM